VEAGVEKTEAQRKLIKEQKLMDLKAKNYLFKQFLVMCLKQSLARTRPKIYGIQ